MKWITVIAMVFNFTACRNAPVELITSSLGDYKNVAPNISSSNSGGSFVYVKSTPITPISFLNSGGPISLCEPVTPLPAGLVVNFSNCEISGTPSAAAALANYSVRATNSAGISFSATIAIVVHAPVALINFLTAAGSRLSGFNGNPNLTFINAQISGTEITAYKYKILSASTPCNSVNDLPSGEIKSTVRLTHDFSRVTENSSIKVCIVGKHISGIWQVWEDALQPSWTKTVPLQRLIDFPSTQRVISLHDRTPNTDAVTRYFSLGGILKTILVTCTSCLFSINDGAYTNSLDLVLTGMFSDSDTIRFKVRAEPVVTSYTVNIGSSMTFSIPIRPGPSAPTGPLRVFLTKTARTGFFTSGLAGADAFCQNEANAYSSLQSMTWKALLSNSTASGLSRLPSIGDYFDSTTGQKIITNKNFVNAFSKFVDGDFTNGGNDDWLFMPGAPRYLETTKFWYGSLECNCGGWTSEGISSDPLCSAGEPGGILIHESKEALSATTIQTKLPTSSPLFNGQAVGFCSEPRHVVCYAE